jgi:argininosuccinate lyase
MRLSTLCQEQYHQRDQRIDELTLEQLQKIDPRFEEDVSKVWDYEVSVERKSSIGGTAKSSVLRQIEECLAFA